MSNIINKSNHPVEIKRIDIQVWKLRDEIEKAIAIRIEENGGDSSNIDIEDIRKFYSRKKPKYLDPDYDPEDDDDEDAEVVPIGADGVDSSGNEMDDDALAMMAALQGGDEEAGEEASEDDDSSEEAEANEEDDEAARMAAEMLGDQGADDEAAKMAAEMLGDQGSSTDSEAKKEKELTRALPDKISSGFSLLSDINMENIVFFSKEGYTYGQNISLKFLIPNSFIISAEVVNCIDMNRKSKIISQNKPNYRIEATITYLWEGERTNLRDFLQSVEPDIPPPPKKIKRPEGDDEDDDEFEDLGF